MNLDNILVNMYSCIYKFGIDIERLRMDFAPKQCEMLASEALTQRKIALFAGDSG